MTKVFVGGSRKIVRLTPEVLARLDRIVGRKVPVVVGDANGADRAIQHYLSDRAYSAVEVFCSDPVPRNNVGAWPVHVIRPGHSRKDFDYYAAKDRAMAAEATVGLMLWDGKSHGTLMNVLRLAASQKPAVIFVQPRKTFVEVRTLAELTAFLNGLGSASTKRLRADAIAEGLSAEFEQRSLGFG